jgi:hypothetical protein
LTVANRRTLLQRMIYALGSTSSGAWVFARVLRPADELVYRLSNERTTLTAALVCCDASRWSGSRTQRCPARSA